MSIRRKILFVSARLPYPTLEGHQIRAFGILKQLSKKYDVHLLSLLREGEEIDPNNELGKLCSSISGVNIDTGKVDSIIAGLTALRLNGPLVASKYVTKKLQRSFAGKIKAIKPDIVHLDLLPLAGLLPTIPDGIKVVLNEHNLESDLIKQKISTIESFILRTIYKREYKKLLNFEKNAINLVDAVLACSLKDVDDLASLGARKVYCIPNGVDTERLKPNNSEKSTKTIVFLGGMGWYPNRLGLLWFLNDVFPLILNMDSSIKIQLIGNPEPIIEVADSIKSNVEVLGFVDDFVPYVQRSALMIVPLNIGSGTRLKVVEGLALGKCMVSTSKGAEGVGLTHGKDILFADTENDFAEQVLKVISSSQATNVIETNARKLAEDVYDWSVIGRDLFSIYETL